MGLKERLQKIKREKPWVLPEEEKTGVINGLILIGAISGAFFALQKEIEAESADAASTCETENVERDDGLEEGVEGVDWSNHCWWDHNWVDSGF